MFTKNASSRPEQLLLTGIAMIPSGMGILAFMNNLTGWQGTVEAKIYPMVSMNGTFDNPAQTWRAIDSVAFANTVYAFVFCLELLFGLLAATGVWFMLRGLSGNTGSFASGVRLVKAACVLAVFIYGFFFFTIGGDWFLAWQNTSLRGLQHDALNYGVLATLAFLILDAYSRNTLPAPGS